ncbi:uncharacterized protein Z518_02315 [Rhinocladiella mackenziei CBS 650.93]|uniref:Polarized growth protein Boi2 n=1 Tax=Rhinocladiella mackenziei CBS 650.93 TaxID=1442369 RepID=A0A0D2FZE9_9EURO|nr:uncharacterized protein Z518_02315 [Rhinocladiella mackenziei CBS 650.93]KIX07662.1 hypothetical protein Z518_02315 [Rhinocladiella mackenziei CBS 650.93]
MSYPTQQRQRVTLQAGDALVVIHDFDARSPDELTLRKGDQIELVELDEGFGDGWYLGRHLGQGTTGLFPGVYTAKLPPNFTPVGAPAPRSPRFPEQSRTDAKIDPPASPTSANESTAPHSTSSHQHSNSLSRSSVSPSSTSNIPPVQRSIGQALSGATTGEESPVMNETLSVIDEHITNLNTPRQSLAPPQPAMEDSGSEYSSHLDRASYIAGPETDSEESSQLTEAEVKQWDAKETADYLRSVGADPRHCDIFEEQEITGDVLLEMDQSFIHMKEFDFGLMGRRLKTWHKIRDFQNQIRNAKDSRQRSLRQTGSREDVARQHSRGLSGTTILPRIPSLREEPGLSIRPPQHSHPYILVAAASPPLEPQLSPTSHSRPQLGGSTPPSPWRASMAAESPSRPSAASIREMNHSRRHSSIDFAKHGPQEMPSMAVTNTSTQHKKNASLDRDWSMSNATTAAAGASTPSLKLHMDTKLDSVGKVAESPFDGNNSTVDLDRGYFSGNEVDNRKARNLLRKRDGSESAGHSRQSSMLDEQRKTVAGAKRRSRLSSVDSFRDRGIAAMSPAAKAYHSRSYKGRFRSASARNLTTQRSPTAQSPTVTNLEDENMSTLSSPRAISGPTSPAVAALVPWAASPKARKLLGLRAAPDTVTGNEKESANSSTVTTEPLKESPVASLSGSQTPSATSRSFEIDNTDTSSKGTTEQLGPLLHTKITTRTHPKTKRQTSAYTRGLLQISPAEARQHCDYHGWMKKRSTGLIAQYKPRLFILRGRRLSYYYSENDTEEKGVIDISGHKVLRASSDPISTLQATIAGNSSTPSIGSGGSSVENSPETSRNSSPATPFFFKLVPPRAGMSRAVQFTKPTTHVFQVDNIVEGRKWMGEILKATIEHDLSSFETTNRQKTVSLAKARARKERPPALKGTEDMAEPAESAESQNSQEEKDPRESGLNIQGLDFDESDLNLQLETDKQGATEKGPEDNAVQDTQTIKT